MLAREGVSLIDYNDYLTHCQAHKSGNHAHRAGRRQWCPVWPPQGMAASRVPLKLHKALGVRCPTPDVFDLADEASKYDPGIADGLALQRVAIKVASDYFERMWPHEVEYGFHRQNVFISAWAIIDLYLNRLTAGKRFTMQGWALYISNQLAIHDYLWHRAAGASSFDKSLIGLRLMLLQHAGRRGVRLLGELRSTSAHERHARVGQARAGLASAAARHSRDGGPKVDA